jgi:hypothetical protein
MRTLVHLVSSHQERKCSRESFAARAPSVAHEAGRINVTGRG